MTDEGNSDRRVEQYAEKIPGEVKMVLEAFREQSELKYGLLVYLIENGQTDFETVADDLGIDTEVLESVQRDLQTGGLVRKKMSGELFDTSYASLEATEWCKRVLDGFYDAMEPKYESWDGES